MTAYDFLEKELAQQAMDRSLARDLQIELREAYASRKY